MTPLSRLKNADANTRHAIIPDDIVDSRRMCTFHRALHNLSHPPTLSRPAKSRVSSRSPIHGSLWASTGDFTLDLFFAKFVA